MRKKASHLSMRQARTFSQVCRLPRDNYEAGDYSIMTDGTTVWLSQQRRRKPPTQGIAIPKAKFDRLFEAYARKRKLVNV